MKENLIEIFEIRNSLWTTFSWVQAEIISVNGKHSQIKLIGEESENEDNSFWIRSKLTRAYQSNPETLTDFSTLKIGDIVEVGTLLNGNPNCVWFVGTIWKYNSQEIKIHYWNLKWGKDDPLSSISQSNLNTIKLKRPTKEDVEVYLDLGLISSDYTHFNFNQLHHITPPPSLSSLEENTQSYINVLLLKLQQQTDVISSLTEENDKLRRKYITMCEMHIQYLEELSEQFTSQSTSSMGRANEERGFLLSSERLELKLVRAKKIVTQLKEDSNPVQLKILLSKFSLSNSNQ